MALAVVDVRAAFVAAPVASRNLNVRGAQGRSGDRRCPLPCETSHAAPIAPISGTRAGSGNFTLVYSRYRIVVPLSRPPQLICRPRPRSHQYPQRVPDHRETNYTGLAGAKMRREGLR